MVHLYNSIANLVDNDNIPDLKELLKTNINLSSELIVEGLDIKLFQRCIINGQLKMVKWFITDFSIFVDINKMLNLACLHHKFPIASWLCDYYDLKYTDLVKVLILYDIVVENWLYDKYYEEESIKVLFKKFCLDGNLRMLRRFYIKNKRFICEKFFSCDDYGFICELNLGVIIWLDLRGFIICKDLMMRGFLKRGLLKKLEWFYKRNEILISDCIDGIKVDDSVVLWCNSIIDREKIYDRFIKCYSSNVHLEKICDRLGKYHEILIEQFNKNRMRLLSRKSSFNNFLFIIDYFRLDRNSLINILSYHVAKGNSEMVHIIFAIIGNFKDIFFDLEIMDLCNRRVVSMILVLLDFGIGFRINVAKVIIKFLLMNYWGENLLDYVKMLWNKFYFYSDIDFHLDVFPFACKYSKVGVIEWIYNVCPRIFDEDDEYYRDLIVMCCNDFNYDNARWLARLYNRFEIIIDVVEMRFIDHNDIINDIDNYNFNFDGNRNRRAFWEMVLSSDNRESTYVLLGISEVVLNENGDNCLICMEKPFDLLKLSCGHFGCLGCLAMWYKGNREICPYCKKNIVWELCKKIDG